MKQKHNAIITILIIVMTGMIIGTLFVIKQCLDLTDAETNNSSNERVDFYSHPTDTTGVTVTPTETTLPEPEHVIASATIGAMGDLLMHKPIFDDLTEYNAAVQQPDGSYDFTSVFQYLTEYTSSLDYAVANLETTLCGERNGYAYDGYPLFNCPDEIVDGVKNAGFDMLLTANNHCYDTKLVGFLRTLEIIRGKGLETLGTYASADETKWTIVEINGIKIGMLCYTWASGVTEDGRPSLNGNQSIEKAGLCNYFYTKNLPAFYSEVEQYLAEMESAGAEATILFIHWGQEYVLSANADQQAIAQKMCDLGIDVIIGGHPHVIQPVELLDSATDPEHKTVCLYSTGNAVSNQRLGKLNSIKTAHTEDGILFSVTFEKYSDGTVYLAEASAIPTWVNMHRNGNGKTEYNIIPLDPDHRNEWNALFELDDTSTKAANDSYTRTIDIIGVGLENVESYLSSEKAARETYYLDLAMAS
ncbi:MAG: CapA family protein [Eubacteriales bacterium]|nr:CapA family protein [Eubacteriales bacterium]